MVWSEKKSADIRIMNVDSDEAGGRLLVSIMLNETEVHNLIYEGMFYSQIDKNSVGLILLSITELKLEEISHLEHEEAISQLYDDCGADGEFIPYMYHRGNHLYTHRTKNREYFVLAKRLVVRKFA